MNDAFDFVTRCRGRAAAAGLVFVALAVSVHLGGQAGTLEPPRARVAPTELEAHGDARVDPYFWLNRREDPEVLAYLKAENEYLERTLEGSRALRETLFEEMVRRIPKDDTTVPYRLNGYDYYQRFEGEGEYPIYCRRAEEPGAPEEIIVNGNELARGHAYFHIGADWWRRCRLWTW